MTKISLLDTSNWKAHFNKLVQKKKWTDLLILDIGKSVGLRGWLIVSKIAKFTLSS